MAAPNAAVLAPNAHLKTRGGLLTDATALSAFTLIQLLLEISFCRNQLLLYMSLYCSGDAAVDLHTQGKGPYLNKF